MKKIKTIRVIAVFLLLIISGFILINFYHFERLPEYEMIDQNIIGNGTIYVIDIERSKYTDEFQIEKTIGKFKGDKFCGFKTNVAKIKGYDQNELILVKGLMWEGIFVNENHKN